jgi:Bacterial pre-peptidase C-terminal domain
MKSMLPAILLLFSGPAALVSLPHVLAQEGKKPATVTLKDGKAVVQSSLKSEDDKDKVQKQPCKVFTVDLQSGKNYQIDMVSKEIDSYLRLEDSAGKQLAKDDDSGGFVNARIKFHCPADGVYQVICTTFNGGTGPFTLTIKETPTAKITELTLKDGIAKVDSKLTDMDATDAVQTHSVCKIYALKLAKGKSYQIDMKSKDIDSFLRLEDSAGKELAKDDDSGGGHDARILFECPEIGEYRIIATTYFGGTGTFTLSVELKKAKS